MIVQRKVDQRDVAQSAYLNVKVKILAITADCVTLTVLTNVG